jgi:hypothetical protein
MGKAGGLAAPHHKKYKDPRDSPYIMKCCTDLEGFFVFGQGPVADCCELGNETSGSIKGGEFRDSLNDC